MKKDEKKRYIFRRYITKNGVKRFEASSVCVSV